MTRRIFITSVLAVAMVGLAATLWAATNETVEVTAKQKDNPQQNPSDVEGRFQQNPTGDKDEIHVTNENATGEGAGVYNDPVNDGALLTITQDSGPVKVDVEGREGIGAMYWVTVIPGGGGGEKTILWADVEDLKRPGALVLKDKNSGQGESDLTDSDENTPELYCARAEDGKGDVDFWLNTDSGTYSWAIKQGTSTVASGTLNSDNDWKASKSDLVVGSYTLEVTKSGDQNFKRKIDFFVIAVDLTVHNGGSDLDNGENTGSSGAAVADGDEETVGAYVLVNWDDDDGDGEWDNDGVCTTSPVPDVGEVPATQGGTITVTNEDNLARLQPSLSPSMTKGVAEIRVTAGLARTRIWTASNKGKIVIDSATGGTKSWDLSVEAQRTEFNSVLRAYPKTLTHRYVMTAQTRWSSAR